jgi:hypothetical protein
MTHTTTLASAWPAGPCARAVGRPDPLGSPAGPGVRVMTGPAAQDARVEALFASGLQRSDAPGAGAVAAAISAAVRRLGAGGCLGRVAQEFGDHPEAAAERMRWVRSLMN